MHVLFIHQAFPAQFGQLGLELHDRFGWRCSYLVQDLSACPTPTPEMLAKLEIHRFTLPGANRASKLIPWAQTHGRYLELSAAVYQGVRGLPELRPTWSFAMTAWGRPFFCPTCFAVRW